MILLKTDLFFLDIKKRSNIKLIEQVDQIISQQFSIKYSQFKDRFFFEQFTRCGGFIIDNWIRIYGCGTLNVVEKNMKYNQDNIVDILIGEDILGGLFGIRQGYIYYLAPDTNEWENLEIYYTQFIDWLLNNPLGVNKFYELFRWQTWKDDCQKLELNEGYHFYPLLNCQCDIEKRSRKIVPIDELIRFNLSFIGK